MINYKIMLTGVMAALSLIFFGLAGNAKAETDWGYTEFVQEYVHDELRFNDVVIPAFRVCIYKDVAGYLFGDVITLEEKCSVEY